MADIGTVMPALYHQFFDNNGEPAVGAKLFAYAAGTTTKQDTYTATDLATPNANPIVLDSAGRAKVFLSPTNYKFVLAPATDTDPPTSPIWTVDGVQYVPYVAQVDIAGTQSSVSLGKLFELDANGEWTRLTGTMESDRPIGVALNTTTVRTHGKAPFSATAGVKYYAAAAGAISATPPQANSSLGLVVGYGDDTGNLVFPPPRSTRTALRVQGFSSGSANASAGADVSLCETYVPAGFLSQPGDAIIIEASFLLANNANSKAMKLQISPLGTVVNIAVTASAVAGHIVLSRVVVRRRSQTTGSISGVSLIGAAAFGAPTNYMPYSAQTGLDWDADGSLIIYGNSAGANDITLLEVFFVPVRGHRGFLV